MTAPPTPRKRGPATPEGKARSALNALRHGLRARRFTLLPHEDPAEFEALAAATRQAYRPACPVERELVEALAVALWREIRADRLEAEILADIPPADDSRSCGSDLLDERHRASFSLLLRYRAQAAGAVRRAQEALARHRKLVAGARPALLAEDRPNPEAERVAAQRECTNEFVGAGAADRSAGEPAAPANDTNEILDSTAPDPLPEAEAGPGRLALRDAVRAARNPLDQPLLRALGRDPELVLPVPGLPPEAWPWAQAKADPRGLPIAGQGPYRRVPHLPPDQWLAHQHLLPPMREAAARAATREVQNVPIAA
ncbi:MAG: hypothetical protein KatS3mg117_3318 [Geminicoccaceae bacterium]|nr:MAG: hypothetical protein KatS3mg117_3318 [Geminicoccaceae bacterium]